MGKLEKAIEVYRTCGMKGLMKKYVDYLRLCWLYRSVRASIKHTQRNNSYRAYEPSDPLISIVVPLFNTAPDILVQMLDSVLGQSYRNWELCLADASTDNKSHVSSIVELYMKEHGNIQYKKLSGNYGIAQNTNEGLSLAQGEYIGLLDHDDILHQCALEKVAQQIIEQGADFIYTDEMTFIGTIDHIYNVHFKPDFSPDSLRGNNYICHFTVFSKQLLDETGWFRSEFNGSQDYDMILRLTEKARRIIHIPQVLYFWRGSTESVSMNIASKLYAIEAGKKALEQHLQRSGLKGSVVVPYKQSKAVYQIQYELQEEPLISIMIINHNLKNTQQCISSVLKRTSYPHYEIIVIDNLEEKSTSSKLPRHRIRRVVDQKGSNESQKYNIFTKEAKGEYVIFLSCHSVVDDENWVQNMLMFGQRADVGVVGSMLIFPNGTVAHGGYNLIVGGVVGNSNYRNHAEDPGYMSRMCFARNCAAVSSACMMVRRSEFMGTGGFDPELRTLYDVDYCLKTKTRGKQVVFCPYSKLKVLGGLGVLKNDLLRNDMAEQFQWKSLDLPLEISKKSVYKNL